MARLMWLTAVEITTQTAFSLDIDGAGMVWRQALQSLVPSSVWPKGECDVG